MLQLPHPGSILARFAAVALAAAPVLAQDAKADPAAAAPAACGGGDLLAELADTNPAAHARVLAAAEATENGDALLWKLERGTGPTSYLFGTVHVTDSRVTTISPALEKVFGSVGTLAVEIEDLSPGAMQPVISKSASLLVFTDGQRLETLLSRAEYGKVQFVLAKLGVPRQTAGIIRPWFISAVLAISDCERAKSRAGAKMLDMKLVDLARANRIAVVGLETMESQLMALAAIPLEEQVAGLRTSLAFADRSNDMMETTLQMYLQRRMGAALQLQRELAVWAGVEHTSFSSFESELLDRRNISMRDRALALLEKGSTLIAVGAMHLIGKSGLVALFREAGYTVTPIE